MLPVRDGYADKALFDGLSLLQDQAYYYIYVEFDDENGKYYPIEGVTLGQAWISRTNEYWDLWAYTSDEFEWNNLSTTPSEEQPKDETISPEKIPHAGSEVLIIIAVIILAVTTCVISYKKYNWFRDIN